ncbi:hypothetical protein NPIL_548881 [Nephila pilipes]|uniref:Uncharacterized protein n=1 Tax=Nephila pilipes TaxID=299642 RepID=A0A8X6UTN2_NEPPI|nr:hypothetical protein NPIL_548881 [Nephila pilipes]
MKEPQSVPRQLQYPPTVMTTKEDEYNASLLSQQHHFRLFKDTASEGKNIPYRVQTSSHAFSCFVSPMGPYSSVSCELSCRKAPIEKGRLSEREGFIFESLIKSSSMFPWLFFYIKREVSGLSASILALSGS